MGVTVMEIALLVVSAIGFVISFLIPESQEKEGSAVDEEAVREEMQKLIKGEIDAVSGQVETAVDESISYAMEKTQRSLERLSNEKIIMVNEYSEIVLKEIGKNHEEVMFLYDMLNNKHENLKKTVTEASRVAKVMKDTVESIQALRLTEPVRTESEKTEAIPPVQEAAVSVAPEKKVRSRKQSEEKKSEEKKSTAKAAPARRKRKEEPETDISGGVKPQVSDESSSAGAQPENPPESGTEIVLGDDEARNNNDKILELHRQGKSNVAIARELRLGVGEVKLVIDLYRNM